MGFIKLSTAFILAASLLSFVAQAAPAPRAIKARDYVTEIVTETVWTTVDITTTLYVDELPSTFTPAAASAEVTSSEEIESTTEPTSVPAATSAPASSQEAPVAPPPPAPSSAAGEFAESSISPTPEYIAPATTVPAETPPAPVPSAPATSEAPIPYVAPAPEVPAPSAPAPSEAPAPPPSPVNSVAENGSCEGGSTCSGDVTHWDGGLGACGTNVDTESDMAIALPHGFMGTLSNSNPYCGRTLTIKTTSGSTVQATVRDKCMGCEGRSIDLTNKLFKAVTDGKGDGRVKNIEWWFSD